MATITLRQCRRICLAALIFLVASGSESLALLPALAQPLCLDGKIWDEEAGSCVDIETEDTAPSDEEAKPTESVEPTEEEDVIDDDSTVEDTDEPENQDTPDSANEEDEFDKDKNTDTGTITAYVFDCPAGLDIYVTEPDGLRTVCTPYLTNIQFELEYDGLVSSSSTNTLGRTTYTSVSPGQYRLRIALPEDYRLPVVFCQVNGPDGQTLENYDRFDVSNSASIGLGVDAMDDAACDFFLVPGVQPLEGTEGLSPEQIPLVEAPIVNVTPGDIYIPDDSPGRVSIVNHECPTGFDAFNASATDINLTCDYTRDPDRTYEYSVTDGAGAFELQHQIARDPYVEFKSVAPGSITVMVSIPEGFREPVVYCQLIGANSEATPYTRWPIVSPNSIQQVLGPSEWLACDWFNVPVGSPLDDITIDPDAPLENDPNGSIDTDATTRVGTDRARTERSRSVSVINRHWD